MTTYTALSIWVLLVVIMAGTWSIRASFMVLFGSIETIPPFVLRVLRLIPAAVLAAIAAPSLTHASGEFDLTTARFFAGVIAAVVAWRTKNVLATITVGMAALWILRAVA